MTPFKLPMMAGPAGKRSTTLYGQAIESGQGVSPEISRDENESHAGRPPQIGAQSQTLLTSSTTPRNKRKASKELRDDRRPRPPPLPLPLTTRPQTTSENIVPRLYLSVWADYDRGHDVDLGGGIVSVATRRKGARDLVMIRRTSRDRLSQSIAVLGRLDAQYFVRCLQVYEGPRDCHLVCEPMSVSLSHIDGAVRPPTEQEIRAIVAQVRDADEQLVWC